MLKAETPHRQGEAHVIGNGKDVQCNRKAAGSINGTRAKARAGVHAAGRYQPRPGLPNLLHGHSCVLPRPTPTDRLCLEVYYDMGGAPTLPQLQAACKRVDSAGLSLSVVEGGPQMDAIVAGGPEREVQLEGFIQLLADMGACGVRVLCYNFMHWGCRVGRTSYEVQCPPLRQQQHSARVAFAGANSRGSIELSIRRAQPLLTPLLKY